MNSGTKLYSTQKAKLKHNPHIHDIVHIIQNENSEKKSCKTESDLQANCKGIIKEIETFNKVFTGVIVNL